MDILKWPFGAANVQSPADAANIAVTVANNFTIVKLALAGNRTLDLTVDAQVDVGAILIVRSTSDGTARDLTLGTAIDGPLLTGTISKTKSQAFFLDTDRIFKPMGAFAQVD